MQLADLLAAPVPLDTSGQDPWCSWNTSHVPTLGWPPTAGWENYPVHGVNWCNAVAYCKWAGKRLCGRIDGGANAYSDYARATRSQWFNACSSNGTRAYPYGTTYNTGACNGSDTALYASVPVGSKPQCEGGYPGIFDLLGNVREWEDSCTGDTGADDNCRLRGGSYDTPPPDLTCGSGSHVAKRNYYNHFGGFRCCLDI